jgi:hypothetical protein
MAVDYHYFIHKYLIKSRKNEQKCMFVVNRAEDWGFIWRTADVNCLPNKIINCTENSPLPEINSRSNVHKIPHGNRRLIISFLARRVTNNF